jgi:integrase
VRFVDAATVAMIFGVERDWVYADAQDFGAIRLGGRNGRLRFRPSGASCADGLQRSETSFHAQALMPPRPTGTIETHVLADAWSCGTRREAPLGGGLPPLPETTQHTLRRTYISIALLANNFDVKWVMGQVGHADSKMTLDVYAQLEQRVGRRCGTSFDRLIRRPGGADWASRTT